MHDSAGSGVRRRFLKLRGHRDVYPTFPEQLREDANRFPGRQHLDSVDRWSCPCGAFAPVRARPDVYRASASAGCARQGTNTQTGIIVQHSPRL